MGDVCVVSVPINFQPLYLTHHRRPRELQEPQSIELLIALLEMTHKYHFESTEAWTCDALSDLIKKPQFWKDSSGPTAILEVASLCKAQTLLAELTHLWTTKIVGSTLPPIPALIAADKHREETLLGISYYQLIIRPPVAGIPPELNRDQRARLLSGYWTLQTSSRWRKDIALKRIKTCDLNCFQTKRCQYAWNLAWDKYMTVAQNSVEEDRNFIAISQEFYRRLSSSDDLLGRMQLECQIAGLAQLKASMDQQVKDILAKFFIDLTAPPTTADLPVSGGVDDEDNLFQ